MNANLTFLGLAIATAMFAVFNLIRAEGRERIQAEFRHASHRTMIVGAIYILIGLNTFFLNRPASGEPLLTRWGPMTLSTTLLVIGALIVTMAIKSRARHRSGH